MRMFLFLLLGLLAKSGADCPSGGCPDTEAELEEYGTLMDAPTTRNFALKYSIYWDLQGYSRRVDCHYCQNCGDLAVPIDPTLWTKCKHMMSQVPQQELLTQMAFSGTPEVDTIHEGQKSSWKPLPAEKDVTETPWSAIEPLVSQDEYIPQFRKPLAEGELDFFSLVSNPMGSNVCKSGTLNNWHVSECRRKSHFKKPGHISLNFLEIWSLAVAEEEGRSCITVALEKEPERNHRMPICGCTLEGTSQVCQIIQLGTARSSYFSWGNVGHSLQDEDGIVMRDLRLLLYLSLLKGSLFGNKNVIK